MSRLDRKRYALSVAIAAALLPMAAAAQTTAPAASTTEGGRADASTLDTIIVSGTAQFQGVRKRDASFSITTVTDAQIKEANPSSTADLLKVVPGVWAESTGGETGANIFVRGLPSAGDAPYVTLQMDGAPLFPPPTLSFLENSTLFRLDDTVERVEVLRGGPSPIFSNGQIGATVNFIQKKGDDTPENTIRVTAGTDNLRRIDLFSGGKLGEGWYYSLGGFFRQTDGVRNTQFPSDQGGQLAGTLTRRWDEGALTVYARHTDDKNAFFTPIPLLSQDNGSKLSNFPGLDAQTGTLLGNDFRTVTLPTGPNGQTITRDLADGRGVNVDVFGSSLDWNVGDWTIANRMNYVTGDTPTNGIFTGANPVSIEDYIATFGTAGTATYDDGSGAVAPGQQVLVAGWWVVDKEIESFTNDLRFSREIFSGNTLTVGGYYARYSSKDTWYLGNNMLLSAQNNARRINVALADGRQVSRDGFVGTSTFALRGDYDGENSALFVADEWQLSERLKLDLGARYERQQVDGTVNDTATVDLDGNPATLYDNATSISLDTQRRIDQNDSAGSWTAGLNFTLNEQASLFARASSGVKFANFDNLRDGAGKVQEVDQYELGLKAGSQTYDLYLTAFYNDFKNSPFQAFLADGSNFNTVGDSDAFGVEVEGAIRPFGGFELAATGVYLDGTYKNYENFTGNQVARQPKQQYRLTPSYYWTMPFGDFKLYTTYSHIGDRFADLGNLQKLPSYDTWDVGATLDVGDHWQFALNGRNVTDELGLTEGNIRVLTGATDGVFLGRPIDGSSYRLSVLYRF